MNRAGYSDYSNPSYRVNEEDNSSPIPLSEAIENKKEKKILPGWFGTQQISEKFNYERYIEITLKDLAIFMIFFLLLWHGTFTNTSTSLNSMPRSSLILLRLHSAVLSFSRFEDFQYQYSIKRMYEETKFNCSNNTEMISMNEITTLGQFWCFMDNFLVDSFHWKYWYSAKDRVAEASVEDGIILFNNLLVGVPRLRQVRVTNRSCEVHSEFKDKFEYCYGFYSSATEDRDPVTPVNNGLDGSQTSWTYSTADELGSHSYSGQLATYKGGGYYLDFAVDKEKDGTMLTILKENLWLSRATRAIFIDFTTLNPNTNSLCFIKLLFEFPPTGGVFPSISFHLLTLNRYLCDLQHYGIIVLLCQIAIVVLTIYFIIEEINELIVLKYKSYFLSWWTALDLIILVFLLLSIFVHLIMCFLVAGSVKNNLNLTEQKTYKSFDSLISWHSSHSIIVSCTLFLTALKFLRLMKIFRFIRNLFQIIFEALYYILAFSILFTVVIFATALIAHLQFGDKVNGLQTLPNACSTLLLALVGHFDLQVLIEYDPLIGSTFCYFYIFLVFFIVTNIIIAILNERYWIKNRLLSRETDTEDLWEPIRFRLQTLMYKIGCQGCASKWFKSDQLNKSERKYNLLKDEVVRRTGETQGEVEDFLNKANVTKKNAAYISKDEAENLMNAASVKSDENLKRRVSLLEAEMARLNRLLKR